MDSMRCKATRRSHVYESYADNTERVQELEQE